MEAQAGIQKRLEELSEKGDFLEKINQLVNFEIFRQDLEKAVPRKSRNKGDGPAFDHVLMLKILILQTYHNLSDKRDGVFIERPPDIYEISESWVRG